MVNKKMNFLEIKDLPLDPEINCGAPSKEEDEEMEMEDDSHIHCGFCRRLIEGDYKQYSIGEIEFRYLCEGCLQREIGLCNYRLDFFFTDELVQLNDRISVHYEEKELISTYQKLPEKEKYGYLEMMGIDPEGAICEANETSSSLVHGSI